MIADNLYPMLATATAMLVYVWTVVTCGNARRIHQVAAPAVTGAPEFERAYRVQMNTIEQMIWFLPSLWLFSTLVSPVWGGILGLVWCAGRVVYGIGYISDPKKRGPGFAIGLISSFILLAGSLVMLVWDLIAGVSTG